MNIFKTIHEIAQYEYIFVEQFLLAHIDESGKRESFEHKLDNIIKFDLYGSTVFCTNDENNGTIMKLSDFFTEFVFLPIWIDPPNGLGVSYKTLNNRLTKEYWMVNDSIEPALLLDGAKESDLDLIVSYMRIIFK